MKNYQIEIGDLLETTCNVWKVKEQEGDRFNLQVIVAKSHGGKIGDISPSNELSSLVAAIERGDIVHYRKTRNFNNLYNKLNGKES